MCPGRCQRCFGRGGTFLIHTVLGRYLGASFANVETESLEYAVFYYSTVKVIGVLLESNIIYLRIPLSSLAALDSQHSGSLGKVAV